MIPNARITLFGGPYPGYEKKALQLFNDAGQFYAQLKQKGDVDSYESFVFDDFNAEFGGFTILRGDPDKLMKLSRTEEAAGFGHRGELLLRNFRIVRGFHGENMQSRMANYMKQVELLK